MSGKESFGALCLVISVLITVTQAGILSTSPAKVLAQPSETVQLQCHYNINHRLSCDGSYLFWYHGNNVMVMNNTAPRKPQYTASLDQHYLNDSIQCTYTLYINDISAKEAGNYACIFIWYEGYYHYEQVMSEVIVVRRPKPEYPICSKKITTTDTGDKSLAFVCRSELTMKEGMFLRWRNGYQTLETKTNVTNGMMMAKYMMNGSKVIQNDTHEYVCEVMYNNVSLDQSCTIQATMGVVINSLYHIKDIPEDSYATFTCSVNMSIPGIGFKRTWYYHGTKIDPRDVHDRFLVDSHAGELHVRNVTQIDGSEHIQCLVTSILGNGTADAMMIIQNDHTDNTSNNKSGNHYNTTLITALVAGAFSLVILVNVLLWFMKGKAKKTNRGFQRHPPPTDIDNRPPVHPELIPYDTDDDAGNIYQYAETPYQKSKQCSLSDDFPYLNTGITKLGDSQKLCSTEDISPYTVSTGITNTGIKNDYINMNKPPLRSLPSEDTEEYECMYQDTETCADSGRGSAYSTCTTESTLLKSVDTNHQYYQAIRTSAPLLDDEMPIIVSLEDRAPTLPRKEGKRASTSQDYQGLDKSEIQSKDSVYTKLKQKQNKKQDDSHIYENIA